MKWMKELWADWILFTWARAHRRAHIDDMLYGNSFVEERWWGYKRICPLKFMGKEFIKNNIVKEYQEDTL